MRLLHCTKFVNMKLTEEDDKEMLVIQRTDVKLRLKAEEEEEYSVVDKYYKVVSL